MARSKKLPSGQWRTLVYDRTDTITIDGKETRHRKYESFTADTKKESEFLAAQFALNKKKLDVQNCLTFSDALENYITLRSAVLSPATIREYKRKSKQHFTQLNNLKIDDITLDDVQKYINFESTKLSPKSVRDLHGLISAVMRVYRPSFALNTDKPKKKRTNRYIPSDDDVKRLIEAVKGTEMELPVLLAAFGPMRRGEISALTSNNIKGNVVHVVSTMVQDEHKNWVIKIPKSYAGDRFIEYPDFVAALWKGKNGKIVSVPHPTLITNRFGKILKRAGIPHFRFHDLRHYSASILHALGVPDAYIMQRGGWGNDSVLKDVYRHTLDEKTESFNQQINNYFTDLKNN